MKKVLSLILFSGVAAALIWLVWFCPVKEPAEDKKAEAEAPVQVSKVSRTTLRSYVVAFGAVEPEPNAAARIAVSSPGVVTAVHCVEGQRVEKGALLFELDARAADLAVQFAEKNLERQRKLTLAESSSQKLLQESEQQLALARAQFALLQIRAPISGIVARVNVRPGESADLTTALAELVDLDRLIVSFNIPSAELAAVKAQQPVEVTSSDSTNAITTTVSFISPQLDQKTDSAVARAVLPAGSGLRPGQFIKARVITLERKDCLVVPLASVARDPAGGWFIALVEGEKAVLKPVKTGVREGDWVEVEGDGVELDKSVVTEGAYGLIMTQQFATKVHVAKDAPPGP
jgi:membrane fusion protein (multidrug efflux system)